jgi:hypothetical protein
MIKVGETIELGPNGKTYFIKCALKLDGTHSEVFVVEDENGNPFVLKKFWERKRANAWLAYRSKENHFGRQREAHYQVFQEINEMSELHPFLVKHVYKTKFWYKNKGVWTWCWVVLQEYIQGKSIRAIINQSRGDSTVLEKAFLLLGETLKLWHSKNLAHGDPHLENTIVEFEGESPTNVKLVDYSQIHHPSFKFCVRCKCFEPLNRRILEDIENNGVMGKGFLTEIKVLEDQMKIKDKRYQALFWEGYNRDLAT